MSDRERIPSRARTAIDRALEEGNPLYVSSISAWEVAMLVVRSRLVLTTDVETWVAASEALPFLEFIPIDNRVAMHSVHLDGFRHRDRADRIVVSTARGLGAALVTGDVRLQRYRPVTTVWR